MAHLEHIGIAVEDPAAVVRLYETLLGVRLYKRERVEREGVQTHFLSAGAAKIELLEALGPDSPVAKYLAKRGEGLHHLAFEVDDVHAQMQRLRAAGFTPLSDTPRPGADGKLIFFLHPKQTHGVLVEFCQHIPTAFERTAVPYRGGALAAYSCGAPDSPALALLHEAGDATDAEPLVRRLEQHFHVLALDAAGHADAARALLDFFGAARAHIFGCGAGGHAALRLALDHPERVDRLAVHGVDAPPPFLDAAALARLRHPVLVSALDRDGRLEAALALRRALPHSTLAVLPGRHLDAALYSRLLLQHLLQEDDATSRSP